MKLASSITTNQGISISVTVPSGRYRIIRRAALRRAIIPSGVPPHRTSLWQHLHHWLFGLEAAEEYAHQQSRRALETDEERRRLSNSVFLYGKFTHLS